MEYNPQNTTELIDAINNANGIGGAHTITLKSNHLYLLNTAEDTLDANGDSALPLITASIHIIGNGAILKRADNAPDFRILRLGPWAADVVIEGVKFLNGKLSVTASHGGAIKNEGGLTLRDTIFEGHLAGENDSGGYGGAILNDGILTIETSNFENNKSETLGGAIFNVLGNSLTMTNCIVRNNLSESGGGGIHNDGSLDTTGCLFTGNESKNGGALRFGGGSAIVDKCTLTENTSNNGGGAVYLSPTYAYGTIKINNCRIYSNVSQNKDLFDFYNDNTTIIVDARNNYWGTDDGPSGTPDDLSPGSGDSVSDGVEVDPILTTDEIPQEIGAGDDDMICHAPANSSNPIGLQNGEKRLIETDLSVQTPAGALTFTRYYRQSKQFDSRFQFMGLGWTHNHAFDLVISGTSPNRTVAVGTPSGGRLNLVETSTDVFKAEAGSYASMEIVSGDHILTMQDRTVYTFNSSFEMISRQMPNNQVWTYTYSNGLLTSVADEYGRGLQFAYDTGYLVRVGDHDTNLTPGSLSGRYVEFEYQNAKAKSTSEGDILATDKLLYKVYDVYQAAKSAEQKDPWTYIYYGQEVSETETEQLNWLIERISPIPEVGDDPITLERLQYVDDHSEIVAVQSTSVDEESTEFNLVPERAYTVEAEVTVNSGSVTMSVTGTTSFDVNSTSGGSQTLSTTVSSWGSNAITRRHKVIIDGADTTVQSITVTETDPKFHTIVQERGIVGTADPLQSTTFVVQPNGRAETRENRAGYESTHLFDRGLLVGQEVMLEDGEKLVKSNQINFDFRSDVNEDANGNITWLNWSTDGRTLDSVTDALSQTTNFTYDDQERLVQSSDAESRKSTYLYNANERQPVNIMVSGGSAVALDINGGMEVDADWSDVEVSSVTHARVDNMGGEVDSGNYAREVNADMQGDGIQSQGWTAQNGLNYLVSARVYVQNSGQTVKMTLSGETVSALSESYGEWETLRLVYTHTTTNEVKYLQFLAQEGAADFYVDSVHLVEVSDPLSWQAYLYDSYGRTVSEAQVDVVDGVTLNLTNRTYGTSGNGNGLLGSVIVKDLIDPSNDISTAYTYDSVGRVTKVQKSSMFGSCDVSYTVYDEAGNMVASICNYDPGIYGDPTTATAAADLYGQVEDPNKNQVTTHVYDTLGRRVATTRNAGTDYAGPGTGFVRTSRTVYDALGRVIRTVENYTDTTDPADWVWMTDHWEDSSSNIISHGSDLVENIVSDVAYNARGLVRMRRDVLGNVSLFGYDDADRL
ncbi:MAG: hypothetical protein KC708_17160, partial [Anaerolineae bacterium]|nr:hypothetical protein [Anaerolineae bacterium]